MTTQRKPTAPTPHEVDRGGRVYYVEEGKVYRGRESGSKCPPCRFSIDGGGCSHAHPERRDACSNFHNGGRGHRTLHPVQAVG